MKRLAWGGWLAVVLSFAAMVVGILIAVAEILTPGTYSDVRYTWLQLPGAPGTFPNGFALVIGTLVTPISALLLIVVTVVGFAVMLYSIEYMHRDHGLPRYYALLSLFLTAMIGLVLSDNLLEFFLFWELVGVCSYFLIGFYYERPAAASAAKEAFLVTRVGDVLFLLGIFLYFSTYATAGPAPGWAASGFLFTNGNQPFLAGVIGTNTPTLTLAGMFILAGAIGKSAQFPLDVWLPDAMEGPTTVSALIHAATMVAAGVYLLAVASIFLGFTDTVLFAIVIVGGFTTFYAATMAVVHPDIKRVIAYSTISQLGYMVLAIGAGFTMVGMFHLFTHAFFKALLFLAAGSVIHAVITQDLFRMGGLRKSMRLTSIAFAIGALALAGLPPFSGFFSKDDVLSSVYIASQSHPLYWPFFGLAFATVFLTAYYIFRTWFLVFSGDAPRDPSIPKAHESPWVMGVPLVALSALSVFAGFLPFSPAFATLLPGPGVPGAFTPIDIGISSASVLLALGGFGLAYLFWGNGRVFALPEGSRAGPLRAFLLRPGPQAVRSLLLRRYYIKDAYDWFGLHVIYALARAADFFDRYVIDGTIRGIEGLFSGFSQSLRRVQSGVVSDYAAYVVTGLILFLLLLLFVAPWIASIVRGG